jgi:hypothetical protein
MKCLFGISTSCVILALMFFSLSCTRSQPLKTDENHAIPLKSSVDLSQAEKSSADKTEAKKEKSLFSKELKESLYFAASLERESLRLISKNSSLEPTTLFSVLSYAFEVASGTKKSPPRNIDCGRFQIEKVETGKLKVLKVCQKPYVNVAILQSRMEDTEFEVTFKIKEWASVVGLSVTLTNPDIVCLLRLKDKKLNSMVCDGWSYFLSASDASATEVHLKTMSFYRDKQQQLKLAGGFFHDLIERKKIDITVPLEGKIKLIEKEIEVKDDFADKIKTSEDVLNEKEKSQQKNPEDHEEKDYQKWIKEGENQNQSQDQTSGQSQEQGSQQNQSNENQNQSQNQEVIEGESSGGVPQQPTKNRGR